MATRRTPLDYTLGRLVPNIQVAKTMAKVSDSEQAQNLIAVHMDALINAVRVPQQAPYSVGDDLASSTWEGWFCADLTPGVQSPVGASCQENGFLFTGRSYINEQLSGYAVCGVAAVGDRVGVLHASRDHEWFTLLLRMTEQEFQQVVSEHGFANADLQRARMAWYIELKEEAAHVLLDSLALVPKKANQAHHPEALSVLCHAAREDWLSNGSGGDSTDLTGLVTDEQPPRLKTSTSRLRLMVFPPYTEELEACFDAMGRPETFDAPNNDSDDDSDEGSRRHGVTLAQRVIQKDIWGPTHGTMLTYGGVEVFQRGLSHAANYGVVHALVENVPRFNELMHSSKRGRLLRFTRPNGQTCAYPQPLVKRANMSAPNGAAAASTKPKPKTTAASASAKPKPKTTAATAKPKTASAKAGAPKPAKAGAAKPAKAGKATKADAKGATKTITKAPKAKAAPKPKPAAPVDEDDTEDTVAAAPAAAAVAPAEIAEEETPAEKDPAPSGSAIEPSDVDEEDGDSETEAAKARAKAAAAKAAARSAAAKKAAATKAAKRAAAGGGEGKATEKKKKQGKAAGGARARKRQKTSSDSDDDGTGDDSDDYVEPDTDESEEASASGSEFDIGSDDNDDDDNESESDDEGGADRAPKRQPEPGAPAPLAPAAAPPAPFWDVTLLKAMTAPVVDRLARRATECRERGEFSPLLATASEAWWERYECNSARLRVAENATEVLVATLALLNGVLEREEAMANDATLPLSASQVGDVRAMMQQARDLGKEVLPNLEQAIQINDSLVRSNAQMRSHLSTMLENSVAAMETIQPAVRALQAASAAAVEAPVEQPRAED
jgi:hypothetical protein